METHETTGMRIRRRREEQGLTLQQIAQEVGIAKSTVQRYENDAIVNVKQPVLAAIAAALSTTADYLLCRTDDPLPELSALPGMDEFTYALYNETQPLTQENKEKLLEMARFFRQQQEKEERR